MRIAIILRKLTVSGGIQRHVLSLASKYRALGHEATVYTRTGAAETSYPEFARRIPVVSLHERRPVSGRLSRLLADRRVADELAGRIDPATEVLNPHDAFSCLVAERFKRRHPRTPAVFTMHDIPTAAWALRRDSTQNRRVATHRRVLAWCRDRFLTRPTVSAQDRIVVLSEQDRVEVRSVFGRDAALVRNGIDLAAFPFQERRPPEREDVRLLTVGVWLPYRGFEDAVQATRILTSAGYRATLAIVGDARADPAYYRRVSSAVRSAGLRSAVTFIGTCSDAELLTRYRESHVFLFPSVLQSWGLTVFEAMATGLPAIVSTGAGAAEVLRDGQTARIVPPQDPAAIAAAVSGLVDDPARWQALSRAGRAFVEANLSWARTAEAMLALFREAVGN